MLRALFVSFSLLVAIAAPRRLEAADGGTVSGTVSDQLGGAVSGATVVLLRDGQKVTSGASDSAGRFSLAVADPGRYGLEVDAAGFAASHVDPFFVASGAKVPVTVTLSIGVAHTVVVTAGAEPEPSS